MREVVNISLKFEKVSLQANIVLLPTVATPFVALKILGIYYIYVYALLHNCLKKL